MRRKSCHQETYQTGIFHGFIFYTLIDSIYAISIALSLFICCRDDENSGYMRGLISKIVTNVRVNFENVVIKYVESDIAFSVNVGEASLTAADENWNDTFLGESNF